MWANIIGLILASLSVGYWVGGRLADRRPSPSLLAGIVLAAAAWVALIPFVARPFLDLSIKGIDTLSTGAVVGYRSPRLSPCSRHPSCCWGW